MSETRYSEPVSVDEVVTLLSEDEDAKCVAGGASLVAMMNARLLEPTGLISLRRVDEIRTIEKSADGSVQIGAGMLHREVASSDELEGGHSVVRRAAAQIANPVVRNMGTLGGSVSHADPAADYPSALAAVGADIEIAGSHGRRTVPATEFFTDWYETALQSGELVTAAILPPVPPGSAGVYEKLAKVKGDLGIAMVAMVLAMDGDTCSHLSIAVGGCGPAPVRLPDAEKFLLGGALSEAGIRELGQALSEATDPVDDVRASADFRRLLIPRMVARAFSAAQEELGA